MLKFDEINLSTPVNIPQWCEHSVFCNWWSLSLCLVDFRSGTDLISLLILLFLFFFVGATSLEKKP